METDQLFPAVDGTCFSSAVNASSQRSGARLAWLMRFSSKSNIL